VAARATIAPVRTTGTVPLTKEGSALLEMWEANLAEARKRAFEAVMSATSHETTADALKANAGWKYKDTRDGVEIFLKPDGDFIGSKGVGIIQTSPDIAHFTTNHCMELRQQLDPMLAEGRHIQRVDKRTDVIYTSYKIGWPVANRDALVTMRWEPLSDGSIFVYSCSAVHPCVPDPRDSFVRSYIPFCGMLFTPLADGTMSRFTYAVVSNPMGQIPAALVNASAASLPMLIAGVRRFLDGPGVAAAVEDRVLAHVQRAQAFWSTAQRAGLGVGPLDPCRCEDAWSWDRAGAKAIAAIKLVPTAAPASAAPAAAAAVAAAPALAAAAAPTAAPAAAAASPVQETTGGSDSDSDSADEGTVEDEDEDYDDEDEDDDGIDGSAVEGTPRPAGSRPSRAASPAPRSTSPSPAGAAAGAAPAAAFTTSLKQADYAVSIYPLAPTRYDSVLAQCEAEAWRAVTRNEDDGWKFITELEAIKVYQKPGPPGKDIKLTKGIGRIPGSPETVRRVFACGEARSKWDEMYDSGRVVEQIDYNTVISYAAFRAPWPVSGRDFCSIGRTVVNPQNGAVFIYYTNYTHPAVPVAKKFVRGVVIFSALYITPVPGQPEQSDVVYALGTDPCGSLPPSLVNAVNVKQPLCVAKIGKLIATDAASTALAVGVEAKKFAECCERFGRPVPPPGAAESEAKAASPAGGAGASPSAVSGSGVNAAAGAAGVAASGLDQSQYHISVAPLPANKYDGMLRAAFDEAWQAATRGEEYGWKFVTELEGVKIYQKPGPPGQQLNYTKGVGRIAGSPETVRCVFACGEVRPLWDDMYGTGRVVEQIDPNTVISYASFKAPWPVSGRDFCSIGRSVVLPDGSIFVYYANYEHPEAPPMKKLVRGVVLYTALLLKPVLGSPDSTDVVYALGTDPCGSLPKGIVNAANIKQPLCIAKIGKLIATNQEATRKAVHTEAAKYRAVMHAAAAADAAAVAAASAAAAAEAGASAGAGGDGAAPSSSSLDQSQYGISVSSLPASAAYDAALERCEAEAWRAATRGEDDGWKFVTELEGVKVYQKKGPAGQQLNYTKGVGRIAGSPETVRCMFASAEFRGKWDDMYGDGRVVERVDANTVISWAYFTAPWPVSSRDFCSLGRSLVRPDGSIFVFSTNWEHPGAPVQKKFVRGRLLYNSLLLRPVPGDANQTDVVYAIGTDPNGSLPKSLVNAANIKQPLCIAKIGKLIASNPALAQEAVAAEHRKYAALAGASAAAPAAGSAPASGVVSGVDQADYAISIAPLASNKYDQVLARARSDAWAAVAKNEDDGWKLATELEGIKIYQKQGPPGSDGKTPINYTKGIGRIPGDAESVRCMFAAGNTRAKWDETYDSGRVVEHIDANTVISTAGFKAPWPVSGRDFCTIGRSELLPNKAIFVYFTNYVDARVPETKKFVRGILLVQGLLITPVAGAPAEQPQCDIIYALGSDLCGSLPISLVNAANIKQPLCVAKIGKLIASDPEVVRAAVAFERKKYKTLVDRAAGADQAGGDKIPGIRITSWSTAAAAAAVGAAPAPAASVAAPAAAAAEDESSWHAPLRAFSARSPWETLAIARARCASRGGLRALRRNSAAPVPAPPAADDATALGFYALKLVQLGGSFAALLGGTGADGTSEPLYQLYCTLTVAATYPSGAAHAQQYVSSVGPAFSHLAPSAPAATAGGTARTVGPPVRGLCAPIAAPDTRFTVTVFAKPTPALLSAAAVAAASSSSSASSAASVAASTLGPAALDPSSSSGRPIRLGSLRLSLGELLADPEVDAFDPAAYAALGELPARRAWYALSGVPVEVDRAILRHEILSSQSSSAAAAAVGGAGGADGTAASGAGAAGAGAHLRGLFLCVESTVALSKLAWAFWEAEHGGRAPAAAPGAAALLPNERAHPVALWAARNGLLGAFQRAAVAASAAATATSAPVNGGGAGAGSSGAAAAAAAPAPLLGHTAADTALVLAAASTARALTCAGTLGDVAAEDEPASWAAAAGINTGDAGAAAVAAETAVGTTNVFIPEVFVLNAARFTDAAGGVLGALSAAHALLSWRRPALSALVLVASLVGVVFAPWLFVFAAALAGLWAITLSAANDHFSAALAAGAGGAAPAEHRDALLANYSARLRALAPSVSPQSRALLTALQTGTGRAALLLHRARALLSWDGGDDRTALAALVLTVVAVVAVLTQSPKAAALVAWACAACWHLPAAETAATAAGAVVRVARGVSALRRDAQVGRLLAVHAANAAPEMTLDLTK
jgi:hypothetical protein